jgi:hypothetical protein
MTMLLRKTLLTLSLLAALAPAAQAQVKLEQKVTESKTSKTEVTSRTTQKLTIAGMEIDTESDSRTTVKSTAGKRDDSGFVKVASKVEDLQVTVKLQGTDYVFDSSNPDKVGSSPLEMLRPMQKASLQRITTTTFDKNNRVSNIEFDQDPLNGLSDDARKLFKGQFETEKLKETANQELDRLPTDPVKVGDVWERTSKLNLEGGQVMTLTTRYTYIGETEKNGRKLDQIDSQVLSVDYALAADSSLPFTLKSSELKASDSKGKLLFDRQAGTIVSGTATLQIKGDLTFVINNNDLPSKLDLKIETTTQQKE